MGSISDILHAIGTRVSNALSAAGSFTILFLDTIRKIPMRPFRFHLFIEQMESIGVNSLPIVLLTSVFTGMIIVLQTGVQLERFGAKLYAVGGATVALARELGPVLTSLVLAGRVGAGISAELGTMKVSEQVDALEVLATDPVHYLVVPRFVAAMIMLPILAVLSLTIGLMGGILVANLSFGVTIRQSYYTVLLWLTPEDLFSGLAKTFVFGIIIAMVGCYHGLNTSGGAEGVGKATTKAVVAGSVLILISDYFLTEWFMTLFSI